MADIELRAQFVDGASRGIESLADHIKEIGAAYLGFEGFEKLVEVITDSQEATIRLDQAFQAFGRTMGQSRAELAAFAEEASKNTFFSSDDIKKAEANLLSFSAFSGSTFKEARETVLDLAAAMGTDASQAALELGRAIESPSQGLRTLRELGIILSPAQKQLIQNFEETGRTAQAQGFILESIRYKTQGLAEDMSNTLGGALKTLKNAFTDAFSGAGASSKALTDSIKTLAATIASNEFKSAIQDLVSAMLQVFNFAAKALTSIVQMAEKGGELAARISTGKSDTLSGQLADSRALLQGQLDSGRLPGEKQSDFEQRMDTIRSKLADLDAMIKAFKKDNDISSVTDLMDSLTAASDAIGKRRIKTPAQIPGVLLDEIIPSDQKGTRFIDSIKSFYDDLDDATKTSADKIEADNRRLLLSLQELVQAYKDSGGRLGITEQDANLRAADALQQSLDKAALSAKKIREPMDEIGEEGKKIGATLEQAFAGWFETMQGGVRGFLQSMIDAIKKIFAEALAHDLVQALGIRGSGNGTSWAGAALAVFSGLFGGGKASGGAVNSGTPYLVGEKGPELFVPSGSGTIVPNGVTGASVNYSPNTVINASAGTDMNQLLAIIAINNDKQRAELLRMLQRNGFGRLR